MSLVSRAVTACAAVSAAFALLHCGSAEPGAGEKSSSTAETDQALSGCEGTASSTVPASGAYYLTSFGDSPSDNGEMSCGEYTKDGSWYYAASRQRYGCGSHIQITANGKCVVAETDDYGPDVCVERAAGAPIIDASPLVAEHLFGVDSAGWSDHLAIQVVEVAASTPLGPCASSSPAPAPTPTTTSSPPPPPPVPAVTCHSDTLGVDEPEGTCVQSEFDSDWYQCTSEGWVSGVANGKGPVGACTSSHPL